MHRPEGKEIKRKIQVTLTGNVSCFMGLSEVNIVALNQSIQPEALVYWKKNSHPIV